MKRRILPLLLALAILWAAAPTAFASPAYTDVPAGHWAAGDIARATELGLFQGVGGGKFGLGLPITRAEFVTALDRFFGWSPAARSSSFTDVSAERWYAPWIEAALEGGAVAAAGDTFRPDDHITRAELVEMLIRGMGYTSLAGQVADAYAAPFSDVSAKKGFITIAHDMGFVGGVGQGRFDPDGAAAREQAASILVRAYGLWNAEIREVTRLSASHIRITVPTPAAEEGTEIPITPLEPLLALYDALRTLRAGGQEMDRAVLCLSAGGVETRVSNGSIAGSSVLTAEEVEKLLALPETAAHYSERHDSAYLIYAPNAYQTATVWYQNEKSLAAKLQLARLFGVDKYIMS